MFDDQFSTFQIRGVVAQNLNIHVSLALGHGGGVIDGSGGSVGILRGGGQNQQRKGVLGMLHAFSPMEVLQRAFL